MLVIIGLSATLFSLWGAYYHHRAEPNSKWEYLLWGNFFVLGLWADTIITTLR